MKEVDIRQCWRSIVYGPQSIRVHEVSLYLKNATHKQGKYRKSDLWFDGITLAEFTLLSTLTLIYRGTGGQNVQNNHWPFHLKFEHFDVISVVLIYNSGTGHY